MANLKDQGFRFVYRCGRIDWTHPAEVLACDIDCTDMSDEQFDFFVIALGYGLAA